MKKVIPFVLLVLILSFFYPVEAPLFTYDAFTNGGFETGNMAGWWYAPDGDNEGSVSSSQAHSGTYSMVLNGFEAEEQMFTRNVTVHTFYKEDVLNFSFWDYGTNWPNGAYAQIQINYYTTDYYSTPVRSVDLVEDSWTFIDILNHTIWSDVPSGAKLEGLKVINPNWVNYFDDFTCLYEVEERVLYLPIRLIMGLLGLIIIIISPTITIYQVKVKKNYGFLITFLILLAIGYALVVSWLY